MNLFEFDRQYLPPDRILLCGVDEAGRGPLAGPVYAAAVILPPDFQPELLNDSKKLTEKRRESLFQSITEAALAWCVASADENEIDSINILNASMLAMQRAVEGLGVAPELVLVDGNKSPQLGDIPVTPIIKGDAKSACIAAASILAKVSRDHRMLELHKLYPQFGFDRHKGYPTKLHYQMLDAHGPSPVHRQSFLRKWRESQ